MYTPNFDPRDLSGYNPIINSRMEFWQRIVGTTRTYTNSGTTVGYDCDRFGGSVSTGVAKSLSIVRSSTIPNNLAVYSRQATNNTAVASYPASEYIAPIFHTIEGYMYRPIYGSDFTFGFWFRASITGTYSIGFKHNNSTRHYVTTFSVDNANTWEYKSVVIPFDNVDTTYNSTNGTALIINIGVVGGTTWQAPTLNVWGSGDRITHPSVVNWTSVAGATINFALPQIRVGRRSAQQMQDDYKSFAVDALSELQACRRYYEKTFAVEVVPASNAGADNSLFNTVPVAGGRVVCSWVFKAEKRTISVTTTYKPDGAGGNFSTNPGTPIFESANNTVFGTVIYSTAANTVVNNGYNIHASYDAEL